jgi:hypothetical protein|tara:strand:+ start:1272 stop:1604 length:333 start_codon:yes stop_codon:yes gene_type:complete
MPKHDITILLRDAALRRSLPYKRYEYVDVTFAVAAGDHVIPYTILNPNDLNAVRWLDITPGTVYNAGTETVAHLYQSHDPATLAWGTGYIVLRSTVANYSTRLLLFLERT